MYLFKRQGTYTYPNNQQSLHLENSYIADETQKKILLLATREQQQEHLNLGTQFVKNSFLHDLMFKYCSHKSKLITNSTFLVL